MVTNRSYFPVIKSVRNGTYRPPFLAKLGFVVSFLGSAVLKAVRPDRIKRMKTFPIWEPATSEITDEILDRFKEHQSKLKEVIEHSKDLVERGTVISSPANRNIVYKLEKAFDIIVTHEKRHFEQSKEVYQLMKTDTRS
jgi:acyl carrier protein